jgi:hypothetical protein
MLTTLLYILLIPPIPSFLISLLPKREPIPESKWKPGFLEPSSTLSLGSPTTASGKGVSESSLQFTMEDGKNIAWNENREHGGLERERVKEWFGVIFNTGGILGRWGDGDGNAK